MTGESGSSISVVGEFPSGNVTKGSGSSSSTKFSKDDLSFFFNSLIFIERSAIFNSGNAGQVLVISIEFFILLNVLAASSALEAFISAADIVDVDDDDVTWCVRWEDVVFAIRDVVVLLFVDSDCFELLFDICHTMKQKLVSKILVKNNFFHTCLDDVDMFAEFCRLSKIVVELLFLFNLSINNDGIGVSLVSVILFH